MKFRKLIAAICAAATMCTATVFADEGAADGAAAVSEGAELAETQTPDGGSGTVDDGIYPAAETQVFDGGSGTEEDPFLISAVEQLELINDFLTYSFRLTNDIELTSDWIPIENNGNYFSGTFDRFAVIAMWALLQDGTAEQLKIAVRLEQREQKAADIQREYADITLRAQ